MHNEISPHPFAAGSVSEPTQYWVDQAEINWMEARGAAAAEIGMPVSRSARLDPHQAGDRNRIIGRRRRAMLGVPLGTGPAHVVELRPVRIKHRLRKVPDEMTEIGGQAVRLTLT
jgi:hypothetical protein